VRGLSCFVLADGGGLNNVGEKTQVGLVQARSGEVVGVALNDAASKTRAGDLTVEEIAVSGECATGRKDTVRLETIFVNGELDGVDGAVRVSVDLRTETQPDDGGDDAEHDLEAGGSATKEATEAEGSLAVVTNGEGGVTHDNYFRRGELRLFLCPVDYSLHTQMDQRNSETRNSSVF
jgi:hypothetical protein